MIKLERVKCYWRDSADYDGGQYCRKHRSDGCPIEKTKVEVRPLTEICDENITKGRNIEKYALNCLHHAKSVIGAFTCNNDLNVSVPILTPRMILYSWVI